MPPFVTARYSHDEKRIATYFFVDRFFVSSMVGAVTQRSIEMTWNGYPPNPEKSGLHVISSKLGRNPTVYRWHNCLNEWEDLNLGMFFVPEKFSDLTYVGEVK